ncbi:hypothetical protein VP01_1946g10 [Puccinia sorghi]|uniref:Fungal lipase-type domain-containing protein n=1 Tax=Puccinia sorghi TaxID=27349 RepID=A0A0L6VC74_9BASI|nr:hypothetical protein VP01_1946g10 [Puccinia sorghi]
MVVIAELVMVATGVAAGVPRRRLRRQVTDATSTVLHDPNITDPKAIAADNVRWYTQDPDQQDHIRLHWSVSPIPPLSEASRKKSDEIFQAAYGDYRRLCPSTFAVQGKEFAVLEEFSTELGQTGYVARVDFMEKIVIVFRGYDPAHSEEGGRLSWDVVPIDFGRPIRGCTAATNCTTGLGVLRLYNSARIATDNWRIAKQAVLDTGLKFSVTGHAIGGAVAQLAALDLGIDGFVHYAHSQAAPRAVSFTAAQILSDIFQGESGQHVVANHDYFPHLIAASKDFTRVNSAVWIFGNKTEWMHVCHYYPENQACLGNGTSVFDN